MIASTLTPGNNALRGTLLHCILRKASYLAHLEGGPRPLQVNVIRQPLLVSYRLWYGVSNFYRPILMDARIPPQVQIERTGMSTRETLASVEGLTLVFGQTNR